MCQFELCQFHIFLFIILRPESYTVMYLETATFSKAKKKNLKKLSYCQAYYLLRQVAFCNRIGNQIVALLQILDYEYAYLW